MEGICTMLQKATDENREVYFLGDLNIDWFSSSCALKKKLEVVMNVCHLNQMMSEPSRMSLNSAGVLSVMCIDHIYTNSSKLCCKAISSPVGFCDHNIVAIARETQLPKTGPRIVL